MSSPSRGSNDSRRTSLAPGSELRYLSVPSRSGSLAQQDRNVGSSVLLNLQRSSNASPAYVSPYPPLPTQTCSSSAAKPIVAIADVRTTTQCAQSFTSAASITATQQEAEAEAAQKQALIEALNQHRMNTMGELRQVERFFATLGSSDLTQPMTYAWTYYVNSNSLLTEIRSLTRNYPFSSECLDEAKRRVYQDPASNRSWNYCWLVLAKIYADGLIPNFARAQASKPEMWGGKSPPAEAIDQLATAFVEEWAAALVQLLRYWESPPIAPRS